MKAVYILLVSLLALTARTESPEAPPERNLASVIAIPLQIDQNPLETLEKSLFGDSAPAASLFGSLRPKKNNFGLLADLQHEIEESLGAAPGGQVKMATFESSMNSHKVGDAPPVVQGFASGVKLENLPSGEVVIEKFEQPFGSPSKETDRVLYRGGPEKQPRLEIEPVINMGALRADAQNNKASLLDSLLGSLNLPSAPQAAAHSAPQRLQPADPLSFLAGPSHAPHGEELSGLLDMLLKTPRRVPAKEIDESAVDPLSLILGLSSGQTKQSVTKKSVRVAKKVQHRSKAAQLSNFLGGLLGGRTQDLEAAEIPKVAPRPQVNQLGLHSGVDQLLGLLEGSEKERLTNPTNEPAADPLAEILGTAGAPGLQSGSGLEGILEAFGGAPAPKKRRVRHRKRKVTAVFGIIPPKNPKAQLLGALPSTLRIGNTRLRAQRSRLEQGLNGPRPFHVPLMNSFYHLRGIRKSHRPLVFPPLGHRKSTLERIRNNVFRLRAAPKEQISVPTVRHSARSSRTAVHHHSSSRSQSHSIESVLNHQLTHETHEASDDLIHHTNVHIQTHTHHRHHRRTHKRHHSVSRSQKALLQARMDDFVADLVARNSDCNANKIMV